MKLPNSYGSISKLSGKRRKPYLVRVTKGWEYDEANDKFRQIRLTLGTFAKREEALHALDEYRSDPYDITKWCVTVQQLYAAWSQEYFKHLSSGSSERTIISAWNYCWPLYNMRARDLKAYHIKDLMESAYIISKRNSNKGEKVPASPGTKARIKSLFNLMLDYGLEHDIVTKNYARTFELSGDIVKEIDRQKRSHMIFTAEEMRKLWDNLGKVKFVDLILIQCYSGWRPQELVKIKLSDVDLERWCMTGGLKTDAGRDRTIPIHSKIQALVKDNYEKAKELGSDFLFNDPTSRSGVKMTYDKYSYRFEKVISLLELNPDHRPHDPRTTFVTMAKAAKIDEYVIKLIIGHEINDVTEKDYTKRDLEWLRKDIEKIP